MKFKISLLPFFALLIAASTALTASAQSKAPQWLTQAAGAPTPTYELKNVPAVVLYNEETVNVSSDGTILRTVRQAIRVLEREGREEAVARVVYQTDTDKVKALDAWLIKRAGTSKT